VEDSDNITGAERSKLKIMLESLLIDLNEEMYELSEELSKSFMPEKQDAYMHKAREFENRKNNMV
jgi:hypothetical protein